MGLPPSVLFFYPQNFLTSASGAHRRAAELMEYFEARGFSVDLVALDGFVTSWTDAHIEDLRRRQHSVHVSRWRHSFIDMVRNGMRVAFGRLPDLAVSNLRRTFRNAVANKHYDFHLISYVLWASLAGCIDDGTKVIDLHDFITLNSFLRSGGETFRFGWMFQDEIRAIRRFDYALSISEEEILCLAPFCPTTRFVDVPISFPEGLVRSDEPKYDLLFVGSADNPFNVEGLSWFIKEVFPLLPPSTTLAVAGTVCSHVLARTNIHVLGRLKDLSEIYRSARVAIAPVHSGTGLKIKVVEAIAHGVPVVTTPSGLSGILQKTENGCLVGESPQAFAAAVQSLLLNQELYRSTREQGIRFFRARYSRDAVWRRLDSVFLPSGPR